MFSRIVRPLTIATLLCLFASGVRADHVRDLVRVYTPDRASMLAVIAESPDVVYSRPDAYLEILAGERDMATIQSLGLGYEIVTRDVGRVKAERNRAILPSRPAFGYGSMGGFYTRDEAISLIDSLRTADTHGIISGLDTLNTTDRGNPILLFKISDNVQVDENEPEVLFDGVHHAREPMGLMNLLYYVEYLLSEYNADPEITYLVDNREIFFVPFVNPDGYAVNESIYFNYSEFGYWRKNVRDNNSNGILDDQDGVDLNRNYGYMWGYDDIGSSPDIWSAVYRGPGPFSELETGAIRALAQNREFVLALNYHSYSDLMIYPWAYNDEDTPDSLLYRELAENITSHNNYQYGRGMETVGYQVNGDTDDWMYGEQGEKPRIIAMTPEIGNYGDGFYPSPDRIFPLAEENLPGNLYLTRVAGGYLMVEGDATVDDTGGDSNGFADQGETVGITIAVKNNGLTQDLTGSAATLSSSSPMIVVTKPTSDFGTVNLQENGDNATDPFQITVSDSVPNGEKVWFSLVFTADGGYVSSDSFALIIGTPETIFSDDAENGIVNFDTSMWGTDTRYAHSGNASFSDSPGRDYFSNSSSSMTLAGGLDLSRSGHAYLTYYARWFIEKDWDIVKVQVSRNGSTWDTLEGTNTFPGSGFEWYHNASEEGYHSNQLFFKKETVDLADYTGTGNDTVYFRFMLYSDSYTEFDGIYVDDIEVLFYPELAVVGTGEGDGSTPSLPRALSLSQNYPNPFNPMTTIEIAIPDGVKEKASLRIYNLRGRLLRTLVDEDLVAGRYSFTWDGMSARGEPAGSGVYLYTLRLGDNSRTRKMLIVR